MWILIFIKRLVIEFSFVEFSSAMTCHEVELTFTVHLLLAAGFLKMDSFSYLCKIDMKNKYDNESAGQDHVSYVDQQIKQTHVRYAVKYFISFIENSPVRSEEIDGHFVCLRWKRK